MAPTVPSSLIPTTLTVTDSDGKPYYNGDELTLTLAFDTLVRWLATEDPQFTNMVEKGFIIDKNNKVLVYSAEHAAALAAAAPTGFTWEAPAPVWPRTNTPLAPAHVDRFKIAPETLDTKN